MNADHVGDPPASVLAPRARHALAVAPTKQGHQVAPQLALGGGKAAPKFFAPFPAAFSSRPMPWRLRTR